MTDEVEKDKAKLIGELMLFHPDLTCALICNEDRLSIANTIESLVRAIVREEITSKNCGKSDDGTHTWTFDGVRCRDCGIPRIED